jgi:glutamyl/glutaminyl-tRNA synthetase
MSTLPVTRFAPSPTGELHLGNARTALFKPLRAALTGRLSGPELGPLLGALPEGTARQRLARFA